MANISPPEIQTRFLIACPRSGSALLMRALLAEFSSCVAVKALLSNGEDEDEKTEDFKLYYSTFQGLKNHPLYKRITESGKRFLIIEKEARNTEFVGPKYYDIVKPAFLLRDPIRTFDSWKQAGLTDINSFCQSYASTLRMLNASPSNHCVLYERLVHYPDSEIERLCKWWDIPFGSGMIEFEKPRGSWFKNEKEKGIFIGPNLPGLFDTVQAPDRITPDIPSHKLSTNAEKLHIENHVGQQYLNCWKEKLTEVRAALLGRTWFAFDLDDTLHEFRKASGIAATQTFQYLENQFKLPMLGLKAAYSDVISQTTSSVFTDGRKSTDYRKERFAAVLCKFNIDSNSDLLNNLALFYEETLESELEAKCGALDLLIYLKSINKKIAIITEGPQDAQEWTLQKLHFKVDFLATSNHFRTSKVHGLFGKILHHLGIDASDMVFVGDNEERDMEPAIEHGILPIFYTETRNFALDSYPLRVNTLKKLEYILRGEEASTAVLA